jgi:hypothetical protein
MNRPLPRTDDVLAEQIRLERRQEVLARQMLGTPSEHIPTPEELPQYREIQARWDDVYRDMELGGAPPEASGETPLGYNLRLVDGVKSVLMPFLKQRRREGADWVDESLARLASTSRVAFAEAEAQALADSKAICADPTVGSFKTPGSLRRVDTVDETGRRTIEWRGDIRTTLAPFVPPSVACVTQVTTGAPSYVPIHPQRGAVEIGLPSVDECRQLMRDALQRERDAKVANEFNRRFPRHAA